MKAPPAAPHTVFSRTAAHCLRLSLTKLPLNTSTHNKKADWETKTDEACLRTEKSHHDLHPKDEVMMAFQFQTFRIFLGLLHRSERMLRRRVDGIEFQRRATDIADIMPGARRNQNGIVSVSLLLAIQIVFTPSHLDQGTSVFDSDKLIQIIVHFQSDTFQ